jgi:hypothetical protein
MASLSKECFPLSTVIDLQQYKELFNKAAPPPFGYSLHQYFGFDPEYINLNHGEWKGCVFYAIWSLHLYKEPSCLLKGWQGLN